ncbi:MAG: hypothetical protein PHW18_07070 [Sulfuricurvum sp.]|uniref:hypothetical protein n=1 Tax=Sulfuricurvum sp. TaxID=2025608 RepID=UPI0026279207|nr:hypothetical protein [Sulfuricurvum sp.]MDD2829321.1 hypothetical protein [Sulfuricurvum sp.]MDD4948638.1 hypothetical protein [Sulfuricurvum sp.]
MQVSSYTFKSPYPQAIQIGQPDPNSTTKEDQAQSPLAMQNEKNKSSDAKVNPTLDSGVTISLSALQSGNSQSGVSEFKSLVNVNQAQKAYTQQN